MVGDAVYQRLFLIFAASRGSVGGQIGHQKEPSNDAEYAKPSNNDDDSMTRALQHLQTMSVDVRQSNPQTQQPPMKCWCPDCCYPYHGMREFICRRRRPLDGYDFLHRRRRGAAVLGDDHCDRCYVVLVSSSS